MSKPIYYIKSIFNGRAPAIDEWSNSDDEEINVLLAQACDGWLYSKRFYEWMSPDGTIYPGMETPPALPDYVNDGAAFDRVKATLMTSRHYDRTFNWFFAERGISETTARQECEAFLFIIFKDEIDAALKVPLPIPDYISQRKDADEAIADTMK